MPFKHFDQAVDSSQIDKVGYKFRHHLLDHPAMTMNNLAQVAQRLPEDQVFYSSGKLRKADDFDRAHIEHKTGLTLQQTVEDMQNSDSYVMIRSPEVDPSFKELYRELLADVEQVMRKNGDRKPAIDPRLYLFVASPNSLTPFHFDRYSTFLMQFQGTKKVYIYPPWDERVLKRNDLESFIARAGSRPPYHEDFDKYATEFDFGPGETLHIPFVAPHYVKNGAKEVSISLSIIFNTTKTDQQSHALFFNHMLRRRGFNPSGVGQSAMKDRLKGDFYKNFARLKNLLKK